MSDIKSLEDIFNDDDLGLLDDGKEIGIVLTPPYITKMMATILDVNQDSKVMDLATGSAGFLIAS